MYVTDPKLGAYSRVKRNERVSTRGKVDPNDEVGDLTATMNEWELKGDDRLIELLSDGGGYMYLCAIVGLYCKIWVLFYVHGVYHC